MHIFFMIGWKHVGEIRWTEFLVSWSVRAMTMHIFFMIGWKHVGEIRWTEFLV